MPATTPRGFRYPEAGDAPQVHLDLMRLAEDVDGQFLTVADDGALPAFGKVGRRAYSVGSGDTFLDIGSAWVNETRGSKLLSHGRVLHEVSSRADYASNNAAALYLMAGGQSMVRAGVGSNAGASLFRIVPSELTVPNLTAKLRIRAAVLTNSTSPGGSWEFVLLPVNGSSGASGVVTLTVGSPVAGSGVALGAGANAVEQANGPDFNVPGVGVYVVGVIRGAAMATDSAANLWASVQLRHV